MPQSLSNVLIHLVYSTKDRHPWLDAEARERLYPYTGGVLRNLGCTLLQMGGTADHVHLLFVLSRTLAIAKAVEEAKRSTSKWMKDRHAAFAWQAGYGAFSVSPRDAESVRQYILNQEEHHKKWSFQDELRKLLTEAGIEFDEQYLWD